MSFIGAGYEGTAQSSFSNPEPKGVDASKWSKYPAEQDVDIEGFNLLNVNNISVAGEINLTSLDLTDLTITNNLEVQNETVLTNSVQCGDNLTVSGNHTVGGNMIVFDNVVVGGTSTHNGNITANSNLSVAEDLYVSGTSFVHGVEALEASSFYSDLTVDGTTSLKNTDINGELVIDGQVGIGTTTPSEALDVVGNMVVSNDLIVNGIIYANDPDQKIRGGNGSSVNEQLMLSSGLGDESHIIINNSRGASTSYIAFATRDTGGSNLITEKMRIIKNGNVGIGTTTPSEALDVVGNMVVSNNLIVSGTDTTVDSVSFGTRAKINPRNFNIYGSLRPIYDSYDGSPFTTDSNLVVRKYDPPLSILSGSPGTLISVGIKDSIQYIGIQARGSPALITFNLPTFKQADGDPPVVVRYMIENAHCEIEYISVNPSSGANVPTTAGVYEFVSGGSKTILNTPTGTRAYTAPGQLLQIELISTGNSVGSWIANIF